MWEYLVIPPKTPFSSAIEPQKISRRPLGVRHFWWQLPPKTSAFAHELNTEFDFTRPETEQMVYFA
jgi:hypothetical protein